jgi:hypothetical protein
MKWIVVAYYCGHEIYKEGSIRLIRSMNKLNIQYDVREIPSLGDWYKNTHQKPTFIKHMLEQHTCSVAYVDIDAEFMRYPDLFDRLAGEKSVNIAVHTLDHSKRRRKTHPPEMLSGTIFMNNTPETHTIVDEWIAECKTDPKLWDQHALHTVLKRHGYDNLPEEYTNIFDYMNVPNPVITHYQASRIAKRAKV